MIMKIEDMISVMMHYSLGGKVGIVEKNSTAEPLCEFKNPHWNWLHYDYKVYRDV